MVSVRQAAKIGEGGMGQNHQATDAKTELTLDTTLIWLYEFGGRYGRWHLAGRWLRW